MGALLTQLLRYPRHLAECEPGQRRYQGVFEVQLPRKTDYMPSRVTSYAAVRINAYVDEAFRQRMFDYVDMCISL